MKSRDPGEPEPESGIGPVWVLELTEAERAILLRACQRYRASIPTYLKSREDEITVLDGLLKKLAGTT